MAKGSSSPMAPTGSSLLFTMALIMASGPFSPKPNNSKYFSFPNSASFFSHCCTESSKRLSCNMVAKSALPKSASLISLSCTTLCAAKSTNNNVRGANCPCSTYSLCSRSSTPASDDTMMILSLVME